MTIVIIVPPLCDQVRDRAVAREGARLEERAAGSPSLVCLRLYIQMDYNHHHHVTIPLS